METICKKRLSPIGVGLKPDILGKKIFCVIFHVILIVSLHYLVWKTLIEINCHPILATKQYLNQQHKYNIYIYIYIYIYIVYFA